MLAKMNESEDLDRSSFNESVATLEEKLQSIQKAKSSIHDQEQDP